MVEINEVSSGFEVSFQYKPWLVDAVKKLPGAGFRSRGDKKFWHVPLNSRDALFNWVKTFGNSATINKAPDIGVIDPMPELEMNIDPVIYHRAKKAKGEPHVMFPYQKQGVAYGLKHFQYINGDDMGLGKTVQSIATAVSMEAKCILVICPATLKENWRREWKEWAGMEAMILSDRIKNTWPQFYKVGMVKVFICNYESLKKYFVAGINKPEGKPLRLNHILFKETINLFDCVIIDELHLVKDYKTQQAKFCMGITKGKRAIIGLTGTPVVNKPVDLISQLQIIGQLENFGGYKKFVDRYCQGYNQASNLDELNYLLRKHCFYRRLKKEVIHDMPDKMRSILSCDISTRADYNKAEAEFIAYLKENLNKTDGEIDIALRGEVMVKMGILKKISAHGKIESAIEQISEVVEAGEKIIVFAHHKEIVSKLHQAIPGSVTVVGDDAIDKRQQHVDSFQNDPKCQVIICNIQSGGVGITLTASSRVLFIELPWHPAHADQAEDRAWRIGQKNSVQCAYLLGQGTIDEHIYSIIEKKRSMVAQVTGAENEIHTEMSMVDDLIGIFSGRQKKHQQEEVTA